MSMPLDDPKRQKARDDKLWKREDLKIIDDGSQCLFWQLSKR
jgi:hypothetical protein